MSDEKRERWVNKTDPKEILTILHSADDVDDVLYSVVDQDGRGIFYIYEKELKNEYNFLDLV